MKKRVAAGLVAAAALVVGSVVSKPAPAPIPVVPQIEACQATCQAKGARMAGYDFRVSDGCRCMAALDGGP